MAFGRVERDARRIADVRSDRLQPVQPRFQRPARINIAQSGERGGERPGGIEQRQIGRAARRLQSACILGVEFAPHGFDLVSVQREGLGAQGIDEIGEREIDRDAGQPRCGQRLNCEHHGFARGCDRIRPDQFSAQLQALARRIELARLDHHGVAAIGEAQRAGGGLETGRGDPSDLRGHVRAQREGAQGGRIDKAEHRSRLARDGPGHAARERGFEFKQRRAHPVIAVRVQHIEASAHHRRDPRRFERQAVFEAFGEEVVGLGHVTHTSSRT